jgi:hypothetical protein
MCVAAQIEVHTVLRSVFEHFWRMYQKDLERMSRHLAERPRQVITAVVMRVVHPDDPGAISPPAQLECGIEQHLHTHAFERRHLLGQIMIAKDADDAQPRIDPPQDVSHVGVDVVARTMRLEAIVARQHTQVHLQVLDACSETFGKPLDAIGMQVGQVQDSKAAKRFRQAVTCKSNAANDWVESVPLASGPQSCQMEGGAEERHEHTVLLGAKSAAAASLPGFQQATLDGVSFPLHVFHEEMYPSRLW